MSLSQIYDLNSSTLWLGRKSEKGTRSIAIRVGNWINCGLPANGRFVLEVCRPTETQQYSYNPVIEFDGEKVIWPITLVDTSIAGQGQCLLRYYVGEDDLIKSKVFKTIVEDSMLPDAGEESPSAIVSFVERIEQAAVDAQNAAEEASGFADDSEQSVIRAAGHEDAARGYANNSAASANSALGYRNAAEGFSNQSRLYSEESRRQAEYAEQSATDAAQSAARAGWAHFWVDEQDGKAYVTMTENVAEEVTFQINENAGTMEVVYNA